MRMYLPPGQEPETITSPGVVSDTYVRAPFTKGQATRVVSTILGTWFTPLSALGSPVAVDASIKSSASSA